MKSLTHLNEQDFFSIADIEQELALIKARLNKEFKNEAAQAQQLLTVLEELTEFELGRFLIKNSGALSGQWTYYLILKYNEKQPLNSTENFILHQAPTVLATRERYAIFKRLLEESIQSNSVVCSIPCGLMGDLLHLELAGTVQNVTFIGIDFDKTVLQLAENLKTELKTPHKCKFFAQDAWQLQVQNTYDVMTTNGLNIYEADDDRVSLLYQLMHGALKPGGRLIGSHLSLPPINDEPGEWDLSAINKAHLAKQKELFGTILQATWSNFRSCDHTQSQLQNAGFEDIEFFWDNARMFYSFSARKPNSFSDLI